MINVRINDEPKKLTPRITVVGVGGAGGNAVNNMIRSGLEGCEFLVCNTDAQALQQSLADRKIQLGAAVTQGLGAGARPDVGRAAAEESIDDILNYLDGSNMVFITCGMGGGTGTGAAAVIARAARDHGILTVGVATKPFHFEGAHRMRLAEEGLKDLQQYVDTLIVIPNQNLFRVANEKTTFADAFKMADDVLQAGVRGVTDLIVMPGIVNLDFADIKSVMAEMGKAMMGTGQGSGDRRAIEAAEAAISNPLLDDVSMKGAKGVLVNVTGGADMTLFEVDEAVNRIRDEVDPEANIIFGSTFAENMEGSMRVSVVATGIDVAQKGTGQSGGQTGPSSQALRGFTPSAQRQATPLATQPQQPQRSSFVQQQPASFKAPASAPVKASPLEENAAEITSEWAEPAQAVQPQIQAQPQMAYGTGGYSTPAYNPTPYSTGSNIPAYQRPVAPHQPSEPVRAQRLQGAFIPPQPMGIDAAVEPSRGYTAAPAQPVSAAAPQAQQPVSPTPGQTYVQPEAEPKRSPTLFERLTNSVTGGNRARDEHESESYKVEPAMSQAQRTLGIDSHDDEELDIPAFLRRQAN